MSNHNSRGRRERRRGGMVHISVAVDGAMADIIERACKAGHPPPSFKTGGYDHTDETLKQDPPPTT